jgi:hypothetical protein
MSLRGLRPTPRALRLLAWSYAMKGLLVALVWFFAPELPALAFDQARAAWARLVSDTR